jgi:hypothetical protein
MSVVRRRVIMMMRQPVSGLTYATWNPADIGTYTVLAGSNLTLKANNNTPSGGRSTIGKSTGKWYWECSPDSSATAQSIAVATSSADLNSQMGSDAFGWGYLADGTIYHNGGTLASVSSYGSGSLIGIALDMSAGTVAFYLNNVLKYTATGLSGTFFAAASGRYAPNGIIANFGATALTYTPPTGFNAGLYV